ncbi:MAG: cobaltochelatase subunit CobN [Burkholderiaceae bacterium]
MGAARSTAGRAAACFGLLRGLWLVLLLGAGSPVQAEPSLRAVLIAGDVIQLQPAALAAAAKGARADAGLSDVGLTVIAGKAPAPEQLAAVADAALVLVHQPDDALAATLRPLLAARSASGARVLDIGPQPSRALGGVPHDPTLAAYAARGDARNLQAMLRLALRRQLGLATDDVAPPRPLPAMALWDTDADRLYDSFDAYESAYRAAEPGRDGRPWVGLIIGPSSLRLGERGAARALSAALQARGFNVVPIVAARLHEAIDRFWLDERGGSRIAAAVLLAKSGISADETGAALRKLDVPIVNAISLASATSVSNKSLADWRGLPAGLSLGERFSQTFQPELAGAVAPTLIATGERVRDAASGLEHIAEIPMPERVDRLADRVRKFVALRTTPNAQKRVALMHYDEHGDATGIEAEFLNAPRSIFEVLRALERDGYDVTDRPADAEALLALLRRHGVNAASPGALAELVGGGKAVLLPLATYRRWLAEQPASLREAIDRVWGKPEDAKAMLWKDRTGAAYFVLPVLRMGKVLLAPQPMRGWGIDIRRAYDVHELPPTHQYLAFYLWLQKEFKPDAVVNLGAHGTTEWLPGRDFGFDADDPGEIMVADLPQFYPFVTSNIGDATTARHRGMATIISHLTPPLDRVTLNSELLLMLSSIDDYQVARQKSDIAGEGALAYLNRRAGELGLLKDIGEEKLTDAAGVEALRAYIKEIGERTISHGLHTFGVAPEEPLRLSTAEAILTLDDDEPADARARKKADIARRIEASGPAETDALLHGLAGRYIAAGPGGNPVRRPEALPTGRNMYSHDPYRLPTPGAWAQGLALADSFVNDYRARHGRYPQRASFAGLWDSLRSDGVAHAQILALMGVRPVWNERGRVTGVEVIPRAELGRPRVDATVVGGGGHGTENPMQILIDQAATLAKAMDEPDNPIRAHVAHARQALQARGIAPEEAERMATVRVFGSPAGVYGTGIDNVIPASNSWDDENPIVGVYYDRMGHLYGQGYTGNQPGGNKTGTEVFKLALTGTEAAFNAYSGDTVASLDHSATYRHAGGLAMAVRNIDGKTPEMTVLNIEGRVGRHETLDRFMGREMRARYTNPKWVEAMLAEGQAGASAIKEVNERLWAWQVVTPEVVDGAKWNEMYETYVADRNRLDIRERFREAGGLLAYQGIVDRMLVAINKGYWKADPRVKADLERVNRELIAEAGVACDADSCSSPEVTRIAEELDQRKLAQATAAMTAANAPAVTGFGLGDQPAPASAPSAPAAPPPAPEPPAAAQTADAKPTVVSGQELREVSVAADEDPANWLFGLIVLGALLAGGLREAFADGVPGGRSARSPRYENPLSESHP